MLSSVVKKRWFVNDWIGQGEPIDSTLKLVCKLCSFIKVQLNPKIKSFRRFESYTKKV